MSTFLNDSEIILALIKSLLGWLFGGFDSLIYGLIGFVAIDYVTGVLLAVYEKKSSSEIGFKGICKKILVFILVALGNIIDKYVFDTAGTLRTMMIMFYMSIEGINIVENAASMGLPLPQKLKDIIRQLKITSQEEK